MNFPNLTIEPDIKFLIQPSSEKYMDQLEEYIVDNGCPECISIWHDIIIDGHKRYKFCKEWEIPFRIRNLELNNINQAIIYVCRTQMNRTDLTTEYRKYLVGKLFTAEMVYNKLMSDNDKIAIAHQRSSDIALKIGSTYNLSYGTVQKYVAYSKSIDKIKDKSEDLAFKILMEYLKISHENTITLSTLSERETILINEAVTEEKTDHLSDSKIWQILKYKHTYKAIPNEKEKKKEEIPKIRLTPDYDPDASLATLKYTSVSWIDSINRAINKTDFSKITPKTRNDILKNMEDVINTINKLKNLLGGTDNNG